MCENYNSFEASFDSGISLDVFENERRLLKDYRRILYILERDKHIRDQQREKLSKITERRPKKKNTDRCNVCFEVLDLEDFKSCAACCNCGKSVCRGRQCSIWLPSQAGWECQLCNLSNESRSRASEWVQRQPVEQYLRPMSARSEFLTPVRERNGGSRLSVYDTPSEAPSTFYPEQKEKIREYVEDILANMLGGSLDEISIGQLSKSKEYLPISGSQNDYEGVSHVKLKRLIEKIIDDVLHLPALIDQSGVPAHLEDKLPPFFDPKKYQELLATAVLNKIVDSYNYEKKFDSSEKAPAKDLDKNHNKFTAQKDQDRSSTSSFEPHSDSSLTDPINLNRSGLVSPSDSCSNLFADNVNHNIPDEDITLTDYLAQHRVPLPDLSVESESASEDFISVGTSNGGDGTWENNWLFKKRKPSNDSPAPIGMLVPAPREDVRALIGDKTTDEVSDLSEAGSDFDGDDMETNELDESLFPPCERVLNKHLIGGKSTVGIFDELLEQTSLVSTSSLQDNEPLYTETRNDFVLGDDGLNDIEEPNINLRSGNVPIRNEAVNSTITAQILQNSPPKSIFHPPPKVTFEESILAPPTGFSDLTSTYNEKPVKKTTEKCEVEVKHLDEILKSESPTNELSGDVASLESNTTDGSIGTVIDLCELQKPAQVEHEEGAQTHSSENIIKEENKSISLPTNNTNLASNNTQITNALNNITSNTDQSKTFKLILGEEDLEKPLKHLIPGSIAEREHKKWYNAVEMPNNPYAPEALIRRLSDGPEKPLDIPNISPVLEKASNEDKDTFLEPDRKEELTVGLEADKPDYKRYSRDYYINDSKHASGSRKYKSSRSLDTNSCQNADSDKELNTSPCCDDKKTDNFGDIFLAKPVRVEESDPILSKATKLEYLSTPERDFYLLPSEEAVNLRRSATPSDQNSTHTTDSLTASEDSDTIRIYDLNKQETRILKDETIKTLPDTPPVRPTVLSFTPKTPAPTRVVIPTSLRFLQPKRKLFDPKLVMTEDSPDKPFIIVDGDLVQSPTNGVPEKPAIEKEVASSLPSVKALAKAFLFASSKATAISLNKPKSSSWQSIDIKDETSNEGEQHHANTTDGPSSDSYSPPYEQRYCPISSPTIPEISETNINDEEENRNETSETESTLVTERSISPVVTPGQLRNSIAFFENLKKK